MSKIEDNWTEIVDGYIEVPDELMPLINNIGNQVRFHTISGKSFEKTICDIAEISRKFYSKNKDLLIEEDNG